MTVKEILSVVPLPQNDIWCSLSFKGGRPSSCHSEVRLCHTVGIPSAPPSLRGSNATAAIQTGLLRLRLAMTKRTAHILTGTFYFKNSALSIVFLKKRQISIFPYPFYIKNYIKLIHSHKRTLPKAKNTKKSKSTNNFVSASAKCLCRTKILPTFFVHLEPIFVPYCYNNTL